MFSKYMSEDVTTAEDAFNVALSKCSNEQERQALITNTLLTLYGDAATKYEESAGSLMDANRAAADSQLAQARLGETIEPVTTAWTNMKTELLTAVAPAIEKVSQVLQVAIQWMQEHPTVVKALVAALAVLAAGIIAVSIAVGIYTAVQMLANLALLPVIGIALAIVAAIAAVVAIVVALVSHWDTVKAAAGQVWQAVKAAWEKIATTVTNAIKAVANAIKTVWNGLVGVVKGIWTRVATAVTTVWNTLKTKASAFANGVKNVIKTAWSTLTNILLAPFRAVAKLIDTVFGKVKNLFSKIGSIGSTIKAKIPFFASGGFTSGPSIAGEAGTEAVISFDPRYRAQNLSYWAEAGRMLGADDSFALSGGTSATYVDLGGVNFAPNIVVQGNAKKDDIVAAIRESYPEFMDLLGELIAEKGATAYA